MIGSCAIASAVPVSQWEGDQLKKDCHVFVDWYDGGPCQDELHVEIVYDPTESREARLRQDSLMQSAEEVQLRVDNQGRVSEVRIPNFTTLLQRLKESAT